MFLPVPFLRSILQRVWIRAPPRLLRATRWTVLLMLTVAVASFAPEIAFVSAASPSSSLSKTYCIDGFVSIPLDYLPSKVSCFPASMVRRSKYDVLLPAVFAVIMVAGSACLLEFLGLWEEGERT